MDSDDDLQLIALFCISHHICSQPDMGVLCAVVSSRLPPLRCRSLTTRLFPGRMPNYRWVWEFLIESTTVCARQIWCAPNHSRFQAPDGNPHSAGSCSTQHSARQT
jgi:hypothetical protein